MSAYRTTDFQLAGNGIATITLARPEKHNAMNGQMIAELGQITEKLHAEKVLRVCVLGAQGSTFCSGGDLQHMQSQMALSREEKIVEAGKIALLLKRLDELPCPLIAKVQGPAYGGGIGLMAVCDVVFATSSAKFAFSETKLGLIPATIGPFVIRRIGEAWARQYFFSAKPFNAPMAVKMNLVSHIVANDDLDEAVAMEAARYLQCMPEAVADAKALVRQLARNPSMETQQYTASRLADCWESNEAKNAISAFFAKGDNAT